MRNSRNAETARAVEELSHCNELRVIAGEASAVGSLTFVERIKNNLAAKAMHRELIETDETYALRESAEAYAGKFTGKVEALRTQNTILSDESVDDART